MPKIQQLPVNRSLPTCHSCHSMIVDGRCDCAENAAPIPLAHCEYIAVDDRRPIVVQGAGPLGVTYMDNGKNEWKSLGDFNQFARRRYIPGF